MILVDVNLLLYAFQTGFEQHRPAKTWLDERLNGSDPVALPWQSLLGFLRITTNRRVFPRPTPMVEAWQQVNDWLAAPVAWVPQATSRHEAVLGRLLALPGVVANLVQDAELAALAIEHDLTLCSADRDFARFLGLRWENPLAG